MIARPYQIPERCFPAGRWPAADGGRFRVATYAETGASGGTYHKAESSDHRTLKAAARRLAHLIARQSRRGYSGKRFDALYIVTPEGERLALRTAQARIKESANVA